MVYGRDPPSIRSYEAGDTRVAVVASTMAEHEAFLADVRCRLEQAQAVQKRHYDTSHRHVSYAVGDWVLLRLRQRPLASLSVAAKGKLQPHFFGPYRITQLVNEVAVRLELPPRAKLHDVFHVGLLKKWVGDPPTAPPLLPVVQHGAVNPEPEHAVRTRLARGVQQVLIRWKGEPAASAAWEDLEAFSAKYPSFQLEDELVAEGGEMPCAASPTPEMPCPQRTQGSRASRVQRPRGRAGASKGGPTDWWLGLGNKLDLFLLFRREFLHMVSTVDYLCM